MIIPQHRLRCRFKNIAKNIPCDTLRKQRKSDKYSTIPELVSTVHELTDLMRDIDFRQKIIYSLNTENNEKKLIVGFIFSNHYL